MVVRSRSSLQSGFGAFAEVFSGSKHDFPHGSAGPIAGCCGKRWLVGGRRRFATMPGELRRVSTWLKELGVEEAVMESTAQYWRSVWLALKGTEWVQA